MFLSLIQIIEGITGNLDLYFGTTRKQLDFSNQTFLITKENNRLYTLFETLFYKVKNYQIFDSDLENKSLKEKDLYNKNKLFTNNKKSRIKAHTFYKK